MADTIIFLYQKGRSLVLSNNAQKLEVKGEFRLFFLILHGFLQGKRQTLRVHKIEFERKMRKFKQNCS